MGPPIPPNTEKEYRLMNLLYDEVYRKKQEQYKLDGDLYAFNSFIDEAHNFQFAVATKERSESEYAAWLKEQL